MIQLENVNATTEPFNIPIGKYVAAIAGSWNGGSVAIERRLPDQRTWQQVASFSKDDSAEITLVPNSAGLHRLRFFYAGDIEQALIAGVRMANRAAAYAVIANDPAALSFADDVVHHVGLAVAAVDEGRVTDATGAMTLAEANGMLLGAVPRVAADPIAVQHANNAVAAVTAMQALKAPTGIAFSLTPQ